MADSWQEAWVEVLPDFASFKNVANGQMSNILGSAGTAGGLAAGSGIGAGVLGGIKRLGPLILGAMATLGIGTLIGKAIGSAINYALDSVDLASDLQQSTGAVEAVFKEHADAIKKLAASASTDVGLTRSAYQNFATIVGAQLKNLGTPVDKISGQTSDLIALGADLAAQFGGPTADAVDALSSLLRGERDPIERYGVSINQAAINSWLAARGMNGLTGAALKNAQTQATLAILLKQTTDAQGTFAREGDTLAGQQQRLQATLQDTQTKLGESLLPAFTGIAKYANETLVPRLQKVIDKVGPQLGKALEDAGPAFGRLLDKVAPLVEDFITWVGSDGIEGAISGLNDFVDHVPEWITFFQDFSDAAQGIFDAIAPTQENVDKVKGGKDVINDWIQQNLVDPVIGGINAINEAFVGFQVATGNAILGAVHWLSFELPAQISKATLGIGKWLFKAGSDLIQGFIDGINGAIGDVGTAIGSVMDFVAGFFPHSPAKRGPFSGSGWAAVAKSGQALADQFTSGVRPNVAFGSLVSGQALASIATGGAPAIYVQNPFTGEYLLSQVDDRADGVFNKKVSRALPAMAGGK